MFVVGTVIMTKLRYLTRSVARLSDAERFRCPNCASSVSKVVDKKYIITKLCRCNECSLLFRTPTDEPVVNERFYEGEYSQGFTTTMPSADELRKLKESNFAGSEKDYSYYIHVLKSLGMESGARVFDFGCSWGYGTYQFAQAGFDATAFEIASVRRRYAERELGVRLVLDCDQAVAESAHRRSYDCFFSAHVLEHIPAPRLAFDYALQFLKPGGIFVSFTPNGSTACRKAEKDWSKLWGEVHPNFIDDAFLDRSFVNSPRAFGSTPVDGARLPTGAEAIRLDDLSRSELFFGARKVGEGW
jgi:2-polyprenyl-3-methyl-5-hydroxy-6-metoxy-1,4-benzoquinol methylase